MDTMKESAKVLGKQGLGLLWLSWVGACSPVDLSDRGTDATSADMTADSGGPATGVTTKEQTRVRPNTPATTSTEARSSAQTSEGETFAMDAASPAPTMTTAAESVSVEAPTFAETTTGDVPPPIDAFCLDNQPDSLPAGLVGFAKLDGYGVGQTMGGLGGRLVFVNREAELREHLSSSEPMVVVLCGDVSLTERLRISSNKSLLGIGPSSVLRGGIDVISTEDSRVGNVIIANLTVDASPIDLLTDTNARAGIRIQGAHHVWLDHLEVYDAPWGLVDVIWGADLVTLSWNKFYFTDAAPDAEHRFGVRVGDHETDPNSAQNEGRLRTTLHHNWFGPLIRQRAPRVAYGLVHVLNNYYTSRPVEGDTIQSTLWATSNSRVLLESNYFEYTVNPHEVRDDTAHLLATGNVYYGTSGLQQSTSEAFNPTYTYTRDSTVWLPALVPWGAGPHLELSPRPSWSDAGVSPPTDAGVADPPDASADPNLTDGGATEGNATEGNAVDASVEEVPDAN